jgi:MFS transporter, NRE family, putaive nickel resistance protein
MKQPPRWLQGLKNPIFARLYLAQTINLVGDALTWLGLALLAFELAGEDSGAVLAGALTLRVTAFVVLSPVAGAIADRIDRKRMMVVTHVARMLIVCLLPFVTQVWQIYAIVLALNVFYAFFTPTYTATIPLVTGKDEYPQAIALSSATFQLLGVLGPGLAGSIAAFVGARQVFFLDAVTFAIAAVFIFSLPGQLRVDQSQSVRTIGGTLQDIKKGTTQLFSDALLRYALAMQLVASVTGAQILINTVGYVQGVLKLGKVEYGWAMAAFGIGATLASIVFGNLNQRFQRTTFIGIGALLITIALLPANYVSLPLLLLLWAIAGVGQSFVNLPTQTLIADRIPTDVQGRVYGAHFAWSHLWWAFAYPLAGWLGAHQTSQTFLYGSLIGFVLLVVVQLTLKPQQGDREQKIVWHDHEHFHDRYHQHQHHAGILLDEPHIHPHQHTGIAHAEENASA